MIPGSFLPQSEDTETRRRASLLFFVLVTLIFALSLVIVIFLSDIQNLRDRVFVPIVILAAFALLFLPLRAGYVRFTARTTVFFLWAVFTVWGYRTGGVFSPAYGANIVVVLIAGLLLGRRSSLLLTCLVVLTGLVLTAMDRSDPQAISGLSSIFVWGISSILLLFAVILLGLSTQGMKSAIDQLRHTNQQLQSEIKQHQQTQQSLRMSEEKYRNLFMAIPVSVYTKDIDGRYTSGNTIHRSYFPNNIDPTGKLDADFQPTELVDVIRQHDLEVMRTGGKLIVEEKYLAPDGKLHVFRSHKVPLFDENGQVTGVLGSSRDITDLKSAEEQLDHYFRLSADMMCIAGMDGFVKRVNPAFEAALGYTEAELLTTPILELIYAEDRKENLKTMQTVLAEKDDGVVRLENRVICKDGTHKWLSWSVVVVGDLIYSVARDVTDEKHFENQRIQLEVDRQMIDLRQNFLSIVSHELRTPLSVILTSSEILLRYDDRLGDERRIRHYDQLVYQARLMRTMIEEILLLNRFNSDAVTLNLQQISLNDICQEMVEIHSNQPSGVTINYTYDSQVEHIITDDGLLRHMLDNLLSNAVKYSLPESSVSFKVSNDVEQVTFVFEDAGIGIPLEDQHLLFEPFQRASNVGSTPGTGLGLAIVKQSVDKLGGTIKISSKHEVGTTVTVKLPLNRTDTPQQ